MWYLLNVRQVAVVYQKFPVFNGSFMKKYTPRRSFNHNINFNNKMSTMNEPFCINRMGNKVTFNIVIKIIRKTKQSVKTLTKIKI